MSDEYITSKQAQDRLQRSERQIRNYAAGGRVRTHRRAGRVLYHADDVDQLVADLRPEAPPPTTDIMPAGELLDHIRELEGRLQQASVEIGYLRGVLESKNLELTDAREARKLLSDREAEALLLKQELQQVNSNSSQRGRVIIVMLALLALAIVAIVVISVLR